MIYFLPALRFNHRAEKKPAYCFEEGSTYLIAAETLSYGQTAFKVS